jgi:excisionase family DNA binding protein
MTDRFHPPDGLITIGQAAALLGVAVPTLRHWVMNGKIAPTIVSPGGHRYFDEASIAEIRSDVFAKAERWAGSSFAQEPDEAYLCRYKADFQHRVEEVSQRLSSIPDLAAAAPMLVSAVAEIGSNSFDHNLGNWPDIPGIFFAVDYAKRRMAIADRGRGILQTLRAVRPELVTHVDALHMALTEIISGRAPEPRGNGLKFVRSVVQDYLPADLNVTVTIRSGDAEAIIRHGNIGLETHRTKHPLRGTIALIQF